MTHRSAAVVALALACWASSACGPETTSFRTTERSDPERAGPPSAPYDVYLGGKLVAQTHVWSSGGYLSSTDEPMTHVGFEIRNTASHALTFDGDLLELLVFDRSGKPLPQPKLTSITPLGPALITVAPGDTTMLAAYFLLPVRPRTVDSMQVRWTLRLGSDEYRQVTGFVRDDDAPILDYVAPRAKPAPPRPSA